MQKGWISRPAIADDAVGTDEVEDSAITAAKIADSQITLAKMSSAKLLHTGVYGYSEYGRCVYG